MKKSNRYAIHPIRTDADYRAALALVALYFDNEPALDSDAGTYFEAMLALIEAYEAGHYPMSPPEPMLGIAAESCIRQPG